MTHHNLRTEEASTWALVLTSVISFAVYFSTMPITLQVGDAGEQITASYFLGVSHPMGTPLYLLLAKGWSLIFPLGTVAFRMNLFNVLLSSLAIFIFARLLFLISKPCSFTPLMRVVISASLALTLAFSKTYWHESTVASSYLLHIFLLLVWLYLLAKTALQDARQNLSGLYLVAGLGLSNHVLAVIMFFATVLYSVSLLTRRTLNYREMMQHFLFVLPGLFIYLYIPIRASAGAAFNWASPDSTRRLFDYISRKNYHRQGYVTSINDMVEAFICALKSFWFEFSTMFPLIIVIFIAAAMFFQFNRSSMDAVFSIEKLPSKRLPKMSKWVSSHSALPQILWLGVLLLLLNFFFVALHGSHTDIFFWKRYMLTGYTGLFLSASILIFVLASHIPRNRLLVPLVLLCSLPLCTLMVHFQENDRSQNALLHGFMKNVFLHIPDGATIYVIGDNFLFPAAYFHMVEGYRPDITLYNPKVGLAPEARISSIGSIGKLFSSHYIDPKGPFRSIPHGIVYTVTKENSEIIPHMEWFLDYEDIAQSQSPLEHSIATEYFRRRAVYHEMRGEQNYRLFWINRMLEVAEGYDRTMVIAGVELARLGQTGNAVVCLKRALLINPKNETAKDLIHQYTKQKSKP